MRPSTAGGGGLSRQWRVARLIAATLVLLVLADFRQQAHATASGYQGVYLEINPYSTDGFNALKSAAGTACTSATLFSKGEFCGTTYTGSSGDAPQGSPIVNGIFFQIPWCGWELDSTSTSCSYLINNSGIESGQMSGPPVLVAKVSTCGTSYDNCAPAGALPSCTLGSTPSTSYGVLYQALYYVCQINQQRALSTNGTLPVLKLSVGLEAGVYTPIHVQDTISASGGRATTDVPLTVNTPSGGVTNVCGRMPDIWLTHYTADYNPAFTALIGYIGQLDSYTSSPTLTIAKIGGLNADTAEIVVAGSGNLPGNIGVQPPLAWSADGGPGNSDPLLDCTYLNSGTTAATKWLSNFNQATHTSVTFAQAIENTFGTLTGSTEGTMITASQSYTNISSNFLLSIATRNGQAIPDVDCGLNNSLIGACTVDNPYLSADQWSPLYLVEAIEALSTTHGAGGAARSAYSGFAANFGYASLGINSTNLMNPPTSVAPPGPPPGMPPYTAPNTANPAIATNCVATNTSCQYVSDNELPCNLNYNPTRDGAANQGALQTANNVTTSGGVISGSDVTYAITGLGTIVGWQTAPSAAQNSNCTFTGTMGQLPSPYDNALTFGTNNGAQYIEVSLAEATTNIKCQPSIATALQTILLGNGTACNYITH